MGGGSIGDRSSLQQSLPSLLDIIWGVQKNNIMLHLRYDVITDTNADLCKNIMHDARRYASLRRSTSKFSGIYSQLSSSSMVVSFSQYYHLFYLSYL